MDINLGLNMINLLNHHSLSLCDGLQHSLVSYPPYQEDGFNDSGVDFSFHRFWAKIIRDISGYFEDCQGDSGP